MSVSIGQRLDCLRNICLKKTGMEPTAFLLGPAETKSFIEELEGLASSSVDYTGRRRKEPSFDDLSYAEIPILTMLTPGIGVTVYHKLAEKVLEGGFGRDDE